MKQRAQLIEALRKLLGERWFLKTTEEFDGSKGGVWTTNETYSETLEGTIMREYEVHPKVEEVLKKHGFYCEPYDAGTLMFYPV